MPSFPGIYAIVNVETGRAYIGSAKNVDVRWRLHRSHLRRGVHGNSRLQRSWNKRGEGAFRFVVLEVVSNQAELLARKAPCSFWVAMPICR